MYQHPIVIELLARDQMARCYESAQRERVARSEPLLSRIGALLTALRAHRSHSPRAPQAQPAGVPQG